MRLTWCPRTSHTSAHERFHVQPLPAGPRPPQAGNARAGDRRAREGEAPRAREGVDPRGARHRVFPHRPLGRGRGGVPEGDRAVAGERLRALRARPLSREAGARAGGERALQARELAASRVEPVPGADPRPRLRTVCQRVSEARVRVAGDVAGEIGPGLCVLLGVAADDAEEDAAKLAGKVARLRIFADDEGRFDRSVIDVGGSALVVSQFTLIADTAKGNRPSFSGAAPPEVAEPLYERFCDELRALGIPVATGVFRAKMKVELVNDGPVTIVLEL